MRGSIDPSWLRTFILSVVKPLKPAKFISTKKDKASVDNLPPDGGKDDTFTHASHFGFVSSVPKGVSAFWTSLFGSGHTPIILGHLHKSRPEPSGAGEAILYSTDTTGAQIKVKVTLKNNGELLIEAPVKVTVVAPTVEVNCSNAKVNATTKTEVTSPVTEVTSPTINLIASAMVKATTPILDVTGQVKCASLIAQGAVTSSGTVTGLVVADATGPMGGLRSAYNSHKHPNLIGPTTGPTDAPA